MTDKICPFDGKMCKSPSCYADTFGDVFGGKKVLYKCVRFPYKEM